jgi:DNA helicase-2/ATP-dependent DNA helicase PcrA
MTLTAEQQAAVACQQNLLLTACPGSGKTRTIAARLAQEIEILRGTSRAVACITYTNAAVEEIEHALPRTYSMETNSTTPSAQSTRSAFPRFCGPFAWLVPGFGGTLRVLARDRPEFETIARYAAEQVNLFNLGNRDFEAFEALSLDAHGRLVGLALRNEAVARAAPHFWRRCQELGFVDFSSIVYKSFCLLRDQPMIARSLAARFASFLVDEFQDTTELQIEILKLIYAQGRSCIFAVGDHAQSIFGFTGARPELIQPFARHIGARTDLSLTGNFRSSPPIVEQAERLIPRNPPMRSVGATRAVRVAPILIQLGRTIDAIREQFLPLLADNDIAFREAAILSKDWASLFPISRALRWRGNRWSGREAVQALPIVRLARGAAMQLSG